MTLLRENIFWRSEIVANAKDELSTAPLPLWLYMALTRKQMRQAISRREMRATTTRPLLLAESLQKLRPHRKKNESVLVRVCASTASRSGTKFNKSDDGFLADRISIEHFSCRKLPGRYQKLLRVDTAGGIVMRAEQSSEILLLLKREGNNMEWVLPKGRRKPGERRRQTALREVQEETGIDALKVKKFLGREGYFVVNGKRVTYKRVSYYLMNCADPDGSLSVSAVEGFIEGRWVDPQEALILTNPTRTHATLSILLKRSNKPNRSKKAVDSRKKRK